MHGREGELWSHRRHMSAPSTSSVAVPTISLPFSSDSFSKDGRKIHVGDCALFKPDQDRPPFVGIIRKLIIGKEDSLSLRVNWLYRPADIKLVKGIVLEAAPNEVFYSFHKDETPAASLLHPCKVAFLRKGVELPPGISSFVCRRVYDIKNNRLWWLTDQDYINEGQQEVDQLLDKTRVEMYGASQSGGRSPKPSIGPNTAAQLKLGSDSVQNSSSSIPCQVKGKKREQGGHVSDTVKRERLRADDVDSGMPGPEQVLKSEIAKITDKGGLVDFEGVEKLVQLMQPDCSEKKIDLACRIMLVDVISVTERYDCLGRFVHLRGLLVLDEWLQEVHKGKIGDGSPNESDKSVEDFLFALLRALDRLPVNLHALQTCNVGKSVNHLRTHRNSEIQRKARTLVDMWKKRVEAEMNMIDTKTGSSRGGSWPTKSAIGSKNSAQPTISKTQQAKLSSGESIANSLSSPGSTKMSALSNAVGVASIKDSASLPVSSSDVPLSTIKEKSSSSGHSQNNSQSCSSDHGKTGASGREDARSSTAGSVSVNKISRSRKSSNGLHGSAASGVQEVSVGKLSLNPSMASVKESPTCVTPERVADTALEDLGGSQRHIVRLSNIGRNPGGNAIARSPEDAFPMAQSGKHDWKVREKIDAPSDNSPANINIDSSLEKDRSVGFDGAHVSSVEAPCDEQGRGCDRLTDTSKTTMSVSGLTLKQGKSYEASFSSINALVESCAKFSEASISASLGDDIGMNLLASVAAGEMSRSDASPNNSPERKSPLSEDSCSGNDVKLRQPNEDGARCENQPNAINGDANVEQGSVAVCLQPKGGLDRKAMHTMANFSGDSKVTSLSCEEKTGECSAQVDSSSIIAMTSDMKPPGFQDVSVTVSSQDTSGYREGEGSEQNHKRRKSLGVQTRSHNVSGSKVKATNQLLEKDKNFGCVDAKPVEINAVVRDASTLSAKIDSQGNDELASWSSSEMHEDDKKKVSHTVLRKSEDNTLITVESDVGLDRKIVKVEDVKAGVHEEQSEKQVHEEQNEKQNKDSCSVLENSGGCAKGNPENMEACSNHSDPTRDLTSGADAFVKLDFDLNEVLPVDDGNQGELEKPPAHEVLSPVLMPYPSSISISTTSGTLPASITVAAAAKGPFLPSESLQRSTIELGWKGSAATSAFRPAEPRKAVDASVSTPNVTVPENSTSKLARPFLDFDLNVGVVEDVVSQNTAPLRYSEPGTSDRGGGGFNLDLNTYDESPENGQLLGSNGSRSVVPQPPARSLLSGGFSNSVPSTSRDFDLNTGPGPDEIGGESILLAKNGLPFLSPVSTVRMNNMELGNFASWFSPGNSYPAIQIPPVLPGRGEQSYPILPAATSQRVLAPAASTSFGPEMFRGPVLSSSPAVAFQSSTPFQYSGFPFDTSFPLPSNSFAGVSTPYVESSSGAAICYPTIPSQLVGPNGAVSAPYRPYAMSLPGGASSVGPDSRKWGSSGLDLNAGPGGSSDVERREERLPSSLRQIPLTGSQFLAEEQLKMFQQMAGGGLLKRKEPDGGRDTDRLSYKHPSWQ